MARSPRKKKPASDVSGEAPFAVRHKMLRKDDVHGTFGGQESAKLALIWLKAMWPQLPEEARNRIKLWGLEISENEDLDRQTLCKDSFRFILECIEKVGGTQ